jgi:SAM-dependent methyltransferase
MNSSYNSEYYDQYFTGVPGDLEYYLECAKTTDEGVLELGCGTGRILTPIARAGIEIWGLDIDEQLLELGRNKLASVPGAEESCRLATADMSEFEFDRQFGLIIVPYRTFQHLLTAEDQHETLISIRNHLAPGGEVAFNIFDPHLEIGAAVGPSVLSKDTDFVHRSTGNRVVVWYAREYDPQVQIMEQELLFEEIDAGDRVVSRTRSLLILRYSFRYEIEYLLERCGFEVVELLGAFDGSAFNGYGEQIWRARRV